MSFNLREFLAKRAARGLDVTTEGQLANKGDGPDRLPEAQLEGSRGKEPTAVSEKQLDAARTGKAPAELTEAQIASKGKAPASTTEKQLAGNQYGGSTAPVEKRLDGVRTAQAMMGQEEPSDVSVPVGHDGRCRCGAVTPCEEADCGLPPGHEYPCPECLASERGSYRGHNNFPGDLTAEGSFNLKAYLKTAKKDPANQVTEGQLGERGKKEPKELTDAQLEGEGRKDAKHATTQALLEKARTGEADRLVEARLDDSKGGLVKHRNPDASKGDIHKLEEQRLKAKKVAEGEKYEPASETDKKMLLPDVKGKDGIRTAARVPGPNEYGHGLNAEAMNMLKQYDIGPHELWRYDDPRSRFPTIYEGIREAKAGNNAGLKAALEKHFGKRGWWQRRFSEPAAGQMTRTASSHRTAQFEEPFNIGFIERETPGWDETDPFVRMTPDIDRMSRPKRRVNRRDIEDRVLVDRMTRDVREPSESELASIDERPEPVAEPEVLLPEEKEGGKLDLPESFVEASVDDVEVGTAKMRQVVLSFDPDDFDNEQSVIDEASGYMFSKYPSLFSFRVGREPIELSKSMAVSMEEGQVTLTLPVAAFRKKERRKAPPATSSETAPQAAGAVATVDAPAGAPAPASPAADKGPTVPQAA